MPVSKWKFARLKKLNDAQLRYVHNALIQGDSALDVARHVRGWGVFPEINENALAKYLAKYRAMKLGALKPYPDLEQVQVVGPLQDQRFDAMVELRKLAE